MRKTAPHVIYGAGRGGRAHGMDSGGERSLPALPPGGGHAPFSLARGPLSVSAPLLLLEPQC